MSGYCSARSGRSRAAPGRRPRCLELADVAGFAGFPHQTHVHREMISATEGGAARHAAQSSVRRPIGAQLFAVQGEGLLHGTRATGLLARSRAQRHHEGSHRRASHRPLPGHPANSADRSATKPWIQPLSIPLSRRRRAGNGRLHGFVQIEREGCGPDHPGRVKGRQCKGRGTPCSCPYPWRVWPQDVTATDPRPTQLAELACSGRRRRPRPADHKLRAPRRTKCIQQILQHGAAAAPQCFPARSFTWKAISQAAHAVGQRNPARHARWRAGRRTAASGHCAARSGCARSPVPSAPAARRGWESVPAARGMRSDGRARENAPRR